jgi:hypothetical protein
MPASDKSRVTTPKRPLKDKNMSEVGLAQGKSITAWKDTSRVYGWDSMSDAGVKETNRKQKVSGSLQRTVLHLISL